MNVLYFWPVITLFLISRIYAEEGLSNPNQFVILFCLYFVHSVLALRLPVNPKLSTRVLVLLCGLFFIGQNPKYENDHYRYLWDGQVLLKGHNPYAYPPMSIQLDDVSFKNRDKVAFPHLTTIYPPLALVLFSTAGLMGESYSLLFLQIVNLLILIWIIPKWFPAVGRGLLVLLPFFMKEFIQSVHIDLLAVGLFSIAVTKRSWIFQILCFFSKYLNMLFWPFLLLQRRQMRRPWKKMSAGLLLLVVSFFWILNANKEQLAGGESFVQYWVWNNAPILLLGKALNRLMEVRAVFIGLFGLFYFFILYRFYKAKKAVEIPYKAVFWSLFLCSPVLNPWYLVWLIPFGPSLIECVAILTTFLAYAPYSKLGETFNCFCLILQFILIVYCWLGNIQRFRLETQSFGKS